MTRCHRCNRVLRNPVEIGGGVFGVKCARNEGGPKPKRAPRILSMRMPVPKDERQRDLFGEQQ